MKRIEVKVLLRLHESVTIPTLLSSAETWTLNCEEIKMVNKMEIWALKRMFQLPLTTPSPAIIYMTGTLYTEIRVKQKQLLYLHKILKKGQDNWVRQTLMTLRDNRAGWAKEIIKTLESWQLETEWNNIENKSKMEWKKEVEEAAERKNREKLREECHVKERGSQRVKTKTKTLLEKIDGTNYERKPLDLLINLSTLEARALIMSRFGMLDCRANFSMGYGGKMCRECAVVDDESHRINECRIFKGSNFCDTDEKTDFNMIYSEDAEQIQSVLKVVMSLWDLEHGKNSMRGV